MEQKVVAVFEDHAVKALNFGPDRIFIRFTESGHIRGCLFEESVQFGSVQEAVKKLIVGLYKEPFGSNLGFGDFRFGLVRNGREIEWLTRESHPVCFMFMDCTNSMHWTFESDEGEFKNEHSARFVYYGSIPLIPSAQSLEKILECRAHVELQQFAVSYDFDNSKVIVNLKWIERSGE